MVYAIWLVVLGALAASNLVVAKIPAAKECLDKISPYQGWIGAASALWGAWGVLSFVLHLNLVFIIPIFGILSIATSLTTLALGLLLGVSVLKTFIKAPAAQAKMDQTVLKLAPYQGKLGVFALILGAAYLVVGLVY